MPPRRCERPFTSVASGNVTPYDPLLETESAEWVRALTSTGQDRKVAERRLHGLLLKVARSELGRRGSRYAVEGPEREDLAYQVAADSLIAIVGKIGTFRGQSRFTTWAHRFVVFEVSATLARHWRHRSRTAAAGDDWEQRLVGADLEPSVVVEHQDLAWIIRVIPCDTGFEMVKVPVS